MFAPNRRKQRLGAGESLIGAWLETGSATCAELMGLQGFDFLILDLEHGQGDLMDAVDILRAVAGTPTPGHYRRSSAQKFSSMSWSQTVRSECLHTQTSKPRKSWNGLRQYSFERMASRASAR